jgi:integrase
MSGAGHIQRRGKSSWRLKFEAERDPASGRRNIQYLTFRGTKAEAKVKLAELVAAVGKSSYVEPSKVIVAEYVRGRIDQWQAAGDIAVRTAERYRELHENQVVPHLGAKPVQKLKPADIEAWHTTLRTSGRKDGRGGVSARTVKHAHRVLSQALKDAVRNEVAFRNVAADQGAPKVDEEEVEIVHEDRVPELIEKLRGRAFYPRAIVALFTGMRLSEILALRWHNVDLEGKVIGVREALEETKGNGLRVKPPKTKAGHRDISMPDIVVDALREHRRQQLELRVALGAGRPAEDALVFPAPLKGGYQWPRAHSKEWARVAEAVGMPEVTFHALRHTHASQLISARIDVVTISRRLGHAKPDITLRVYAHLFRKDDSTAAAAINEALKGLGAS